METQVNMKLNIEKYSPQKVAFLEHYMYINIKNFAVITLLVGLGA